MKKVTVADVAALAGVSPGTVSKALGGKGQLRPETRRKVLEAAQELRFQPNLLARSLVEGRTYTVGIITSDSYGRFTIPVMLGAEDALGAYEIAGLLCDGRDDPIREQHYLRTLLSRRVDGIIVTGRGSNRRQPIGRDLPVPVVYALARSADPDDLSVVPDDVEGAALAVRHLIATGRRRIAHVTGPAHQAATDNRIEGTLRELTAHDAELALGGPLVGEWSEHWGRAAAAMLVKSGQPFDGVFCGSDQIARGVLDGLADLGIRAPGDVGVIGVDNWDVMVTASRPPLSTIDLELRDVGRVAAECLLGAIEGRSRESGLRKVPGRLVIRESTAL